ncbi:hypothetical protein LshimejAT787_0606250 [Lyophyllum shimeji]|uniref:Uncharacterized protein n=1 Tax=Lyophyllum shimeji TaxID=47721 RepID=A0A9P3PP40_LYOSH|nr:hypothetical protein LshimejAT787_0606250 [Lyophyllum shimeji]
MSSIPPTQSDGDVRYNQMAQELEAMRARYTELLREFDARVEERVVAALSPLLPTNSPTSTRFAPIRSVRITHDGRRLVHRVTGLVVSSQPTRATQGAPDVASHPTEEADRTLVEEDKSTKKIKLSDCVL